MSFEEGYLIKEILYTKEDIRKRVRELGRQLSLDYINKNPLVVGVLTGAFMFLSDLVREIECRHEVEFLKASSYGDGTTSSGMLEVKWPGSRPVQGRHVILVEDIVDTGLTLATLVEMVKQAGCASVSVCALLNKTARRTTQVQVDYSGFQCPDEFVVGFGLDFDARFRSLPYIGVLKAEVYSKTTK
mmetsp:Transcript_30595/g.42362  ORF Transcript_30595/g.42362 Transcript_30595/m.42362 type:complete len:187 (-) Transcript_30595:101-661(-)|eukprot:CAMPEP_0196574272 /NCGR_PEP_ID=MMETSP1081-20130531/4020_1 /TAXON_ID=36882 /ORGANISM="Pyramimonas amylifera, Strain CCMP720" /LENGTH=186 /DNA_ID=CAMNT_0041892241 /DNA_START=255 /DNA_END=815 /DNA_ORIENTATION=+